MEFIVCLKGLPELKKDGLREAQDVRENVEELVSVEINAMLESDGHITHDTSSSSSETDDSETSDIENNGSDCSHTTSTAEIKEVLTMSNYNWFSVVETLMEKYGDVIETEVEKWYSSVLASDCTEQEKTLLEQSHNAYLASVEEQKQANRQADCLNGMVVTDSETDDPNDYLHSNFFW